MAFLDQIRAAKGLTGTEIVNGSTELSFTNYHLLPENQPPEIIDPPDLQSFFISSFFTTKYPVAYASVDSLNEVYKYMIEVNNSEWVEYSLRDLNEIELNLVPGTNTIRILEFDCTNHLWPQYSNAEELQIEFDPSYTGASEDEYNSVFWWNNSASPSAIMSNSGTMSASLGSTIDIPVHVIDSNVDREEPSLVFGNSQINDLDKILIIDSNINYSNFL